ncbi:hypothetical protein MMC11_006901 [Xylographa trunciseda]|nr:hypothetical protein [Xylographa trunciseda]
MPFHRKRLGGDISAIFVHAGAGYHSVQNEKVHLQACADASKAAMTFLKNGGSAVDAVEVAIKVLEDKEITNAGYGSNLAIDGTVECDATVVDHYGRSGAVGAVSQIANPIHLARLVLEHSSQPLSLRRVPPNLLVGQGATDFAFECGMPVLPHDFLISPAAKERWIRWNHDLRTARRHEEHSRSSNKSDIHDAEEHRGRPNIDRMHSRQLQGLRNESQPYSPVLTPTESSENGSLEDFSPRGQMSLGRPTSASMLSQLHESSPTPHPLSINSHSVAQRWDTSSLHHQGNDGHFSHRLHGSSDGEETEDSDGESFLDPDPRWTTSMPPKRGGEANGSEHEWETSTSHSFTSEHSIASTLPLDSQLDGNLDITNDALSSQEDNITDTVGAIAVDCFGHIAAGSSSGGIGMKHKGRTGPAALVGIGTSVIPVDPEDRSRTCLATVTSGTGEHMATTSAAGLCASRLYYNQKKGKAGQMEETDEEGAIRGFVEKDFMGHPSVKNSHSAGAIGVMAVKKEANGIWLHFAHNTDSFALASFHSEEDEPACVMSRGRGNGAVTSGARSIRHYTPRNSPSARSSVADEPKSKKQKTGRGSLTRMP